MPGTVNWKATYEGTGPHPNAQLYDSGTNIARSTSVPCEPPVGCPFPMDNVGFGTYTAALVSGSDRYYYDAGQEVITVPNDTSHATPVTLSSSNPTVNIKIKVQAGEPA